MNTDDLRQNAGWFELAECRGANAPFFGLLFEKPQQRKRREKTAKAICGTCPVRVQCKAYGRHYREHGVWGGETEDERFAAGFLTDVTLERRQRARNQRERIKIKALSEESISR